MIAAVHARGTGVCAAGGRDEVIDVSIPATTGSITAEWLTETLHRGGQLEPAA